MTQLELHGIYYIQQVADMTGLSKQLIRKWEERYALIKPQRLENGYRIYSQKDINILLKIKLLSEQGYSIKQASALVKDTFESIEEPIPVKEHTDYEQFNEFVCKLLEKGTHCNELELSLTLQQAYHHLGLDSFLTAVVVPFLKEVGKKWEKKEWKEYQESVSSLIVRDFLVQIRRNYQFRENAPFVLGACLPNEKHEVPLHLILLQFMMKGWKTQLVGASPAPGSIEFLVTKLKPDIVLLSATTTEPFEKDPQLLAALESFAMQHKDIDFYIGGQGASTYMANKQTGSIRLAHTIEDILQ